MEEHQAPDLVTRLDRVGEKLSRLRVKDRAFRVFGSNSHRYLLRPPLSEDALTEYERRLGAQLPAEYRLFVTRIGHGGAGPYYGLFPLNDKDSEDITDLDLTRKPFRWVEAFNPYDWDDPCSREDVWCDDEAEDGERAQVIIRVPGALYISHYGCAIRFFLVVKGLCNGEVWCDSQADDTGVMPECGEDSRRLGFLDWYESWLDEGIRYIGST